MAASSGAEAMRSGATIDALLYLCTPQAAHGRERALGDVNWSLLYALAGRGGVAGLVCAALERLAPSALPLDIRRSFVAWRLKAEATNTAFIEACTEICSAGTERGLPIVPIKGAAMLLGQPYSDLGCRSLVDVDLVTDVAHFAAAEQLLRELGFHAEQQRERAVRHEHHVRYVKAHRSSQLLVELHWTPFYRLYGSADVDRAAMARLVTHSYVGRTFRLLDIEDTLAVTVLHLANHRFRGQLKWAVDVAWLLHRFGDEVRWDVLSTRVAQLGATRAVMYGLWLVAQLFGRFDESAVAAPLRDGRGYEGPPSGARWALMGALARPASLVRSADQPALWERLLLDGTLHDHWLDGARFLLHRAAELFERHTPARLPGWAVRGGSTLHA